MYVCAHVYMCIALCVCAFSNYFSFKGIIQHTDYLLVLQMHWSLFYGMCLYMCLSNRGCVLVCWVTSVISNSVTLWTVACQAPLSMGFSRQEYWSGLPYPPPGDLPRDWVHISLVFWITGRFFTTEPQGKLQRGVFTLKRHCKLLEQICTKTQT